MSAQEVALFPIPNLVAFPGTVIPLHVFEPRYRQLVKDCLEHDRPLGVCHTRKTIREAPKDLSAAEMLNSNQATYQPQEVFSAGPCKLIETTPDGRLLAEIHVEQRLVIKAEKQTLPYKIVTCEVLEDSEAETADCATLQQQIIATLVPIIARQNPEVAQKLADTALNPTEFSFQIFQFLRLDPDVMQSILEARSTYERLDMIWQIISQH
ncbi:MAG: LON peptidase substrate-binding domain-containing protein [Pseudomonadales bacterium]